MDDVHLHSVKAAATSSEVDKTQAEHRECANAELAQSPESPSHADNIKERNRIIRKIDKHLLPQIFVMYSFSVLDRSNLGNARIAGMSEEIDISGRRYDWLGTAFYIAYILSQWLCIGWQVFPPHMWVAFCAFGWGLVSTLQAVCTTWSGLMISRVFLGIMEACYAPGVTLYLSYFYPREKAGFRVGIFLSGSAAANAYGGILAYGISHARGAIAPWRTLFIVEGIPTCLLAIVTWFFLPDGPGSARFLSNREKEIATQFNAQEMGPRPGIRALQKKEALRAVLDYRTYLPALMYFGSNVAFASLPLFSPTIISQMGAFTKTQSQGLSAPPYAICFFMIVICTSLSDRYKVRGPFIVGEALLAAIGFIILATTTGVAPRYFGLILGTQMFVCAALVLTWASNTHENDSQRAVALAILATGGQLGPVVGTNIFPIKDKPYYRRGMWVSCGSALIVAAAASLQMLVLYRTNKKLDEENEARNEADGNEQAADLRKDKGFRYIL
ncbi:hypothetical protein JDV02_004335 [Purpureocillium takamizusanense]|uniref:Major facilitator superfamily (MFS) profile domain-containing protein n=1 Tax=Purpureocillium takamizusanense TaxID=2060973 RepID=A0A9Q8QDL6_9HYPO|nr:uncharacterized protein JDV02_004335 [Purpureocillium takamizusanense]UNI18038.1 hypothetical protein JDV02_004335 [Purpureocillium takamizusanense]